MLKVDDTIFPGENWFFYWKTSASLWSAKLKELKGAGPLIVPLNWAFHFENADSYDFAKKRPETDLEKLVELAREIQLDVIFYIPLGPAPWLPNGGIPSLLAKNCSIDRKGVVHGVIDKGRFINKICSFFDPEVYHFFCKFMYNMGEYFSKRKISSGIFGIRCGYFERGFFYSFFEDRSKVFQKSFTRFLSLKQNEGENISGEKGGRQEFTETISDLYLEGTKKYLRDNWEGVLDIAFLGGGMENFFDRLSSDRNKEYADAIFSAVTGEKLISSVLLPSQLKSSLLSHQLRTIGINYQRQKLEQSSSLSKGEFQHLCFFTIHHYQETTGHSWKKAGLINFLNDHFKWTCQYCLSLDLDSNEGDENDRIHFISGKFLNEKSLGLVFKQFLRGGKIIVDRTEIPLAIDRKLSRFFLENSFEVEKVNFHIPLDNISVGDSRMLLLSGKKLHGMKKERQNWFWKNCLGTFDLSHLSIKGDQVTFFWQARMGSSLEFDYREIRRVHLYNPSSERKRVSIPIKKNFVLIKVVESKDSRMTNTAELVNIELSPGGMISLDYGIFN